MAKSLTHYYERHARLSAEAGVHVTQPVQVIGVTPLGQMSSPSARS